MPNTTSTKVALVTGANKGIGFEVARQIAQSGITVLLGARSAELGEKAAATLNAEGLPVRFLHLDITDPATIATAAQTVTTDFGHLDILVNNAGITVPGDGAPSKVSTEALDKTMRTNFFGAVSVTQALLPLLRLAPSASIVNVSSGLGSLAIQSDPGHMYAFAKYLAYSSSKAALNMFTVHLAYELRDTAIKVNSADPGYTATDLNGNNGTQTIQEGAAETIRLALLSSDGPSGTFSAAEGPVAW